MLDGVAFYQDLVAETNVKLELVSLGMAADEAKTKLNLLYASGDYGDAIWGGSLIAEADYSQLAAANILVSLKPYIEDEAIMPNFNNAVLSESPNTKAYITSPDGEIYSLCGYNKRAGAYLESPIGINKKWLDALELDVPTTIEEFKAMLIAFRDRDPNGNGVKDEIPYIFLQGDAWRHMEALLGIWGLATKDNGLDNYVMVQDGKVVFVPTADAYKAAVTEIGGWYEEGLIWSECFTGNAETLTAKLTSDPAVVGVYTQYASASEEKNGFIQALPPVAEGYERVWYYHPGWQGVKGKFSMTSKCEYPEVMMHYMDLFYDYEYSIKRNYGYPEEGRYTVGEDGKYYITALTTEESDALAKQYPTLGSFMSDPHYAWSQNYYDNILANTDVGNAILAEAYAMYSEAGIINDEIWPRPYFNEDDSVRLGELRTDIFNVVTEMRAKWVTGASDIDADWDAYVEKLDSLGLPEFLSILQAAYDAYLEAM